MTVDPDDLTNEELTALAKNLCEKILAHGKRELDATGVAKELRTDILISALLGAVASGIGFRFKELDGDVAGEYLDEITQTFVEGIGHAAGVTVHATILDDEKHAEAIAIIEKHGLGKTEH